MSQQNMQFDERGQSLPGEREEVYTPRQVNVDPREQSQRQTPVEDSEGTAEDYGGYEPGYAGQRQRQEEKLKPGTTQRAQPQGKPQKRRGWLRPLIVVLIILAVLGATSSGFRFLGIGTTTTTLGPKTFIVDNQATITVTDNVGNITIHKGSGNQVVVNATVKEDIFGHNPQVDFQNADNNGDLAISVKDDRSGLGFFNLSSVDLDITVPDNMVLDLHTSLGNIDIEDVQGQVTAESNAGNVTVTDAHLSGRGQLHSNAGNVDFEGDFADYANYTLKTNAGNVTGTFDPNDNVSIEAHTNAGNIDSEVSSVHTSEDGPVDKRARGDLGSDENRAHVSLETNAGNINIDSK